MTLFNSLIEHRRSIRKFKSQPVEQAKMENLIEAALSAPSSMSRNPWEFIVVTNGELLTKLSLAKQHGSSFLARAPACIVVCADPQKCDVWIEDTSIASIFIHLGAHGLGLGSCWIQIRDRMHSDNTTSEEYIRQILDIPNHLKVESIIAVGYPDEQKPPHKREDLRFEKVHLNKFGQPYSV